MEKRGFLRMELSDPSKEEVFKKESDIEVLDISAEGACIRTSRALSPGKVVSFDLDLKESGEHVSFVAQVKWIKTQENKHLVGLHFIK